MGQSHTLRVTPRNNQLTLKMREEAFYLRDNTDSTDQNTATKVAGDTKVTTEIRVNNMIRGPALRSIITYASIVRSKIIVNKSAGNQGTSKISHVTLRQKPENIGLEM